MADFPEQNSFWLHYLCYFSKHARVSSNMYVRLWKNTPCPRFVSNTHHNKQQNGEKRERAQKKGPYWSKKKRAFWELFEAELRQGRKPLCPTKARRKQRGSFSKSLVAGPFFLTSTVPRKFEKTLFRKKTRKRDPEKHSSGPPNLNYVLVPSPWASLRGECHSK